MASSQLWKISSMKLIELLELEDVKVIQVEPPQEPEIENLMVWGNSPHYEIGGVLYSITIESITPDDPDEPTKIKLVRCKPIA